MRRLDPQRDWCEGTKVCGMTKHACGARTVRRRCDAGHRHPHGRSRRLTGVVARQCYCGDTYGRAVTRSRQSWRTGRGLMARAGFRDRSARSAAHPGGVVAGRQYQHDRESSESRHRRLAVISGKMRASVIAPVSLQLARCRREIFPDRSGKFAHRPAVHTRSMNFALTVLAMTVCVFGSASAQQPQPKKPEHMDHKFDDPARYAKSFDDPARDKWQMPSRVIEALGLKPGMKVADIGAGTGYFSMRLAKTPGVSVFAADIEPKMVDYLKNRAASEHAANVSAVLASATSPNLPEPVDVIVVVDTYHHLPNRPAYFRDLRKSLRPGGRIAIVDFRKEAPEGPPVHFRFTPQQIEDEMKAAGYQLERSHDFLPRQHFLIFR